MYVHFIIEDACVCDIVTGVLIERILIGQAD